MNQSAYQIRENISRCNEGEKEEDQPHRHGVFGKFIMTLALSVHLDVGKASAVVLQRWLSDGTQAIPCAETEYIL